MILPFIVACGVSSGVGPTVMADNSESAMSVFNERILPIFRSEKPSSCVQCHLSSVDLKNYILPSSDATFASLRDQGLIDLDHPKKSKILTLIKMGEKDLDEGAKLLHADTRDQELTAFAAWVEACCADTRLRDLPKSELLAKPELSDEVIRHARKSRIVDSFVRNVWSQRMRCFPCHTPHEVDPENPKHRGAVKRLKEFKTIYDEPMLARLELFKKTPEATMSYWIDSSRDTPNSRLPLVNLQKPSDSLVVQKPMSKLPRKKDDGTFEEPAYQFPLSHMGGLKLHKNDHSYKSIVGWIQDYSKIVDGKYQSVAELPKDNWHPTQKVLRMKSAPESWEKGTIVQMFVHSWDSAAAAWNEEPTAFTQGTVTPRRMVNGPLFLLGSSQDLPPGRYLVKAYLDSDDKIEKDPSALLTGSDYQGSIELKKARWRIGFRFAEVVNGKDLSSD